jgi:hypothetical protein
MVTTGQPVLLVGLRTDGLGRNDAVKTADRENPNSRTGLRTEPSKWGGRRETSSLIQRGWNARKVPAIGEVFFLTFPFIELHRWDEKAGLRRDAIRSQWSTRSKRNRKETGYEKDYHCADIQE